jgi:uncharacterized protein YndB with AHSA1/START domain
MLMKIAGGIVLALIVFVGYVSTRPGHFHYERSGVINAPAERIYPYLVDFQKGNEWSPYEKMDPNMKKTYSGTGGVPGAVMTFEGNSNVGTGSLELLKTEMNKSVEIRLRMTKPMPADNLIVYTLTPEGDGTRFTWSLSGDGGFLGKLMSVLIDCEKMIGGQLDQGIANLKTLVETKP